jgi:hypothetical protein
MDAMAMVRPQKNPKFWKKRRNLERGRHVSLSIPFRIRHHETLLHQLYQFIFTCTTPMLFISSCLSRSYYAQDKKRFDPIEQERYF